MEQYLYLTTRGRKTGRPREIEIWFTERQGRYFVIAEYETSNWLLNLQANPAVQVKVGHRTFPAQAQVLPEGELKATIQELSLRKYGWAEGIVVELAPTGE